MPHSYEIIFENNKKWVQNKLNIDPQYFEDLAKTQNPEFLYIGCSDSRATAEELIGKKPGEVLVHRRTVNVVNALVTSSAAVIQYAVEHL